jgi:hypothetical protein
MKCTDFIKPTAQNVTPKTIEIPSKGMCRHTATVGGNHVLEYAIWHAFTVAFSLPDVKPQVRQAERGVSLARLAVEEFAPHGTERLALLSLAEANVERARTTRNATGAQFAVMAALECSRLAVENLPWAGLVGTPAQA